MPQTNSTQKNSRRPVSTTDLIRPEPLLPDGEQEIERENQGDENIEPNRRQNPPVLASDADPELANEGSSQETKFR